jgi:hydrogenase nickel incorporation protein HypB
MKRVSVEKNVLSENDRVAASLRESFRKAGVFCLNFIGSPGAGKTALLERTLARLSAHTRVAVLTGDIQTENDAIRLRRYGYPVRQISTGGACHLDARMVERHLDDWVEKGLQLLLIENVGNLVCPTSYDLGENAKVAVLSVAEGEDKPLKYPGIFRKAALMIVTKIDLLPHVPFQLDQARANAHTIHPDMEILEVSATTGVGLDDWMRWLASRRARFSEELQTHQESEVNYVGTRL